LLHSFRLSSVMQHIDKNHQIQRMRARVATALLRRRDHGRRRVLLLRYAAILLVLFVAHSFFSNLSSPLKLVPQTLAAIAMGYIVLLILSLRHFKHVVEFIDWGKVIGNARCPACGNELAGGLNSCPSCGLVLDREQAA
jgi:hypothetical protein